MALKLPPEHIRVLSVGVGVYPAPKQSWFSTTKWAQMLMSVELLQKTRLFLLRERLASALLEINTQSMDQLSQEVELRHVVLEQIGRHFRVLEGVADPHGGNLPE